MPELITVILIIAVTGAVTLPRLSTAVAGTQADSIARQIQNDLELARRTAMNRGRSVTVTFDFDQASYASSDVRAGNPGSGFLDVDLRTTYDVAVVLTANFGGGAGIVFNAQGVPTMQSTSETPATVHDGEIYVAYGSLQTTLHIHPRLSLVSVDSAVP